MYEIRKERDHLLVEFLDDFDYLMVQTIIRHETMLKEYPDTNDIWLVGKHHANIRLGELEAMVEANSPTEAVVKFRCTREYRPHPTAEGDVITSVYPVDCPDTVLW